MKYKHNTMSFSDLVFILSMILKDTDFVNSIFALTSNLNKKIKFDTTKNN